MTDLETVDAYILVSKLYPLLGQRRQNQINLLKESIERTMKFQRHPERFTFV